MSWRTVLPFYDLRMHWPCYDGSRTALTRAKRTGTNVSFSVSHGGTLTSHTTFFSSTTYAKCLITRQEQTIESHHHVSEKSLRKILSKVQSLLTDRSLNLHKL